MVSAKVYYKEYAVCGKPLPNIAFRKDSSILSRQEGAV